MKRLLKRWLAMALAVLMVVGTLPTTAFAARITDDVVGEQPVLSPDDPVADTQGRHDDDVTGEKPVDPIDPDGPTADLSATAITNVAIDVTAVNNESGVFASGTTRAATDGDTIAIMILPRFRTTPTGSLATVTFEGWNSTAFTNAFITPNVSAITSLDQFKNANMPYAYFRTGTSTVGATVTLDWNGTVKKGDNVVTTQTLGSLDNLKKAYLAEYVLGKTFYDPDTNAVIDPATDGLPFTVFIGGTETTMKSFSHAVMRIKVTTQPLKVELVERLVDVKDTSEGLTLPQEGGSAYAYVKVTNRSEAAMTNVTVQLKRGNIVTDDPGAQWGNITVGADNGETDIGFADYADCGITLGHAYGFADGTNAWGTYTIGTLQPGEDNAVYLPLVTPVDEALFGDANLGWGSSMSDIGVIEAFYSAGTWDGNDYPSDIWSSYTAEASCASGEYAGRPVSASANGGIHWAGSLDVEPKVRLVKVNADGTTTPLTQDEYKGMKKTNNMADSGEDFHQLKIGSTANYILEWVAEEGGYYGLSGGRTVELGSKVFVDGINTQEGVKKGFTDVPAYAVTVAEDGSGGSGNPQVLGDYTWDRVKSSRVQYSYYPTGTTVNVYAGDKLNAFDHWSGAAVTSGTSMGSGLTGSMAGVTQAENGYFNPTADTTVTAHYDLVNVKFFTTFKGTDINNATPTDRSKNVDHVFKVELYRGTTLLASATKDDSGDAEDGYSKSGTYTLSAQAAGGLADPWSVTLPGGTYTLNINGHTAYTINTSALTENEYNTLLGKGTYHFLVELGAVTPKVEGATHAESTLKIPHDENPAATDVDPEDGYVPVNKDTTNPRTLYYPVGTELTPALNAGGNDQPKKVSYNGTDQTPSLTDGTWEVSAVTVASNAGDTENSKPLVATFGAGVVPAVVNIYLDNAKSDATVGSGVALYTGTTKAADLNKDATGVYSADVTPGSYRIYVNGTNTGIDITVGDTGGSQDVRYWTVTLNAGTGATAPKVNTSNNSLVVLDGTTGVTLSASAQTYYNPNAATWTKTAGVDQTAASTTNSTTLKAITETTTYTVSFAKLTATITVNLQVNGTTQHPGGSQTVTVTGQTDWTTTSDATKEFTVEQGNNYTVALGTFSRTITAIASDQTVNIPFYTLKVTAEQTVDSGAKVAQSATANPPTANQDNQTGTYLTGTTVYINAAPSGSNYSFTRWKLGEGTLPTTATNAANQITLTQKTELIAEFSKPKYDTYLNLILDDSGVTALGGKITSVKLGTHDATYDTTVNLWKYAGVISATESNLKWSVVTPDGAFTVDQGTQDSTTAPAKLELYTLKLTADQTKATAAQVGIGTSATAQTVGPTVYKKGTSVSFIADPKNTDYEWDAWTVDVGGITAPTSASASVTMNQKTELTATFKKKLGTVTVQVLLDGNPVNDATVTLSTKTPTSVANGIYTFSNVEYNGTDANKYDLSVSKTGYVGTHTAKVTVNQANVPQITVRYWTVTAATAGHGDAKVEVTTDGLSGSAQTDYANGTPVTSQSIVVINGTAVKWTSMNPQENWKFSYWQLNNTTTHDTSDPKTLASVTSTVTYTANFIKDKYNTYLVVNVNTSNWATKGTSDTNIKEIQLVNTATGTASVSGVTLERKNDRWEANGVSSASVTAPYWRITTVDGGVYYEQAKIDDVATKNFYGVKVAETKPAGCLTATVRAAGAGSAASARVVTPVGNVTAAETHSTGYTLANWEQTNDPALANVSISGGTVTLQTGYNAATDLVVTPTYTFATTIETRHLTTTGTLTNVTTVQLAEVGAAPTINCTKQTADGTYSVSGLDPAKTYDIWVNGFKVGAGNKQITSANAGGKVPVVVFKVTTARDPAAGGTSNVGLNAAGTGNLAIVPNGAAVTAAAPTVNAAATVATGYRKRSVANDGANNSFWTASAGDVTTPEGGTGNATTWTIGSMTADVTLTAHYVRQYTATVSVDPTTGGTAIFTEKGSTGSSIGTPATSATVDSGDYVKAEFTHNTGNTLNNWTFSNGTLWTTADKQAGTQLTSGTKTTATTVYFFPTADNASLVAKTEAAVYPVEIRVNLDNEAYAGRKVELRQGGAVKYTLTESATEDGLYTAKVLPGNYDVYVDGVTTGTTADSEKNLNFTAAEAESTDVNEQAKLKAEVNYYTIDLVADPAGTAPKQNKVNFAGGTAGTTASKIVLAKVDAYSIGNVVATAFNEADGTHYRFDNWAVTAPAANGGSMGNAKNATTTYTLPAEATLKANTGITPTDKITLTASFVQQFKVTVQLAAGIPSSEFAVHLKETGEANWAATNTIMVDSGDTVTINGAANGGGVESATRVLSEWTVPSTDHGEFDNSSHAAATKPANGKVGYVIQNGIYTPKKDSVLELNAWRMGTLTAGWVFDKGTGTATSPTGAAERRSTWTKNNGQAPTKVTVLNAAGTATFTEVLDAADYVVSGGDGEYYTITAEHLREEVPNGTYTLNLTYVLGPVNHPNNVEKTAQSTNFIVTSNKHKLTETNVQVKDKASDTANPNTATTRDGVIYKDHTAAAPDIKHDELIFTWYYANSKPTQTNFNAQTDPAAAAKTAAMAVSGATLIGTAGATGVGAWNEGTNSIATGAVTVTSAMRGKYIYAVVEVDAASETAEGAVITNAIPVDYDAEITVNKDGSHVTADNYKVFLVPSGTAVTQADFAGDAALNAKGIKKADTFNAATGIYSTSGSPLKGATNYVIWVSDAEGSTYYLLANEAGTVTPLSNTGKNVNYFSVNRVDFSQSHTQDKDNRDVGETFDATNTPAINSVTTSNGSTVADGNGVHTGTSVTAKSSTWNQDYTLTWKKSTGNDPVAPTTTKQNSTTANATGYANGAVTAKTNIGGELVQNTYLVRGDIKGSGSVATAKLTANGHEFTGKVLYSGAPGTNVVEFTVPKSAVTGEINENYVISATMGANTTLVGYSAPSKAAADQVAPLALEQVTKAENGKFAIHIVSTTLSIEVKDTDNEAHKQFATGGSATATVNHSDKEKFADYNQYTRTVVITNQGNTPLTVTLGITKGTNTTVYDGTQTLTGGVLTDGNGVTIGGLERTFDLAVGASKSFVVTIPADLNNDDDVAYHFNFSTVDGRDGVTTKGPDGVYNLNITIDPVTVSKVATNKIKDSDGNVIRYDVKETWVAEDGENPATKPHYNALVTMEDGDYNMATNADIVYEWYVAPWNATVKLNKNTGVPYYTAGGTGNLSLGAGTRGTNNLTYTPTAGEKGMALFLVAKGQRDATSAAMTPDVEAGDPVELVPFDGLITIHENTTLVTDPDEGAKYTVYLWNTQGGDEIDLNDTENLIPTQWSTADNAFMSTKNLWASDPENPDSTKPWTYKVYASIVKDDATLKNTGKTITVGHRTEDVVYYKVDVDDTSVHQNDYEGKLNIPDGSKYFYKTAPTVRPSAAAEGVAGKDVVNTWVQTGTKVTFTYPQWTKDYDLTWSGGVTATDKAAAGNAGAVTHANVTYSSQLAQVKTQLKLNLYPVKANATGTAGWVNYLTMALEDGAVTNTFTSLRTQTDNILGIDDSGLDSATNYRIGVGKSVTFRLPKADGYTTTAHVPGQTESGVASWNYRYGGQDTPGDMDNPGSVKITVNVTGDEHVDTYDVNLIGEGLNMKVSETSLPKDKTDSNTVQSGMGSIPNADTAAVVNGTVNQEIHLNYNYPTGQTVVMEVENTTEGTAIWNVRSTPAAGNTSAITASSFTGGKMEPAAKEEITLTIADGLDAGEYKYSADFSFENKETGGRSAKVTYTLKVVVDPLPFTNVTIKKLDNGTLSIDKYQVTPTGAATATETEPADPVAADDKTALTYGDAKDYQYQWYAADAGSAQPTVTWAAGVPTVSGATAIAGATNKTFDPSTQQGKDIYLVIYANNDSNASQAAISTPITSTFQGVVKISVDGTTLTADPGVISGTTDPVYTVNFVNGSDKIKGTWDNTAQGYVAALEPTKTYTVEVSRAKDDKTNLVTLADVSISNANRTATAPYFTVNAVNFVNKEYQTGTGEDFTGVTITPAFTIGTDHAALPNGTPVLSGQSVAAKAPALSAPNADKAWVQDYTLTWRQKSDDNTAAAVADVNLADSATTGQSATAAIANGAYAYGAVTHKTFIGGRLDQKTYEVVGTVKNETGMTGGHVLKVELAESNNKFTLTTATEAGKLTTGVLSDGDNNGVHGEPGDTAEFTVVKGIYNITSFDGVNTTIQRVTVNTDDTDTDKTRNKETLTPTVQTDDRVFTIYVAGTALKLKVADNEDAAPHNNATSEGSGNVATNYKHAYNEETHYFNATAGTFPLTLSNPGNTDLKLGQPKVYKLAAGSVNASTNMTGVTLGTALALTSGSYSDDNLTISGLDIANTALAVNGTTAGGSLTLKKTAANKDDAVYVVEFPSTYADTNGNTPVGPTVYYVLDLTVEPLPIVSVTTGKNATTGELSLEGYDKNDATNKTGLDHVMVDHDGSAATDAVAANSTDANLKDGDLSFVWAVSDKGDLTAANFEIDTANNKMVAKDGVATVDTTLGKTRQPSAAEEGKFFYLIAYRSAGTANASEFAVSDAVYAQVTISLKTQRYSDKTQVADTSVQIEGTYGTGETASSAKSNSGTLVIPADNSEISFTADEADNATPANAKYYFVGWGPEGDDRIEVNADDRLAMTYAVTKQDTVIGYYDLLPVLTGANGCTIGAATIPVADRTFTYKHNDGSGNVRIEIKPADGSRFLAVTGAEDEDLTTPRVLNATAFEKIAGQTSGGKMGADGDYVLTNSWITANLEGDQDYIITFYDLEKGVENEGYAGYDRSKAYVTSTGDKDVTAVVADDNKGQGHTVQVTNGVSDGTAAETSTASTVNGVVTIHANPAPGYVFTGWKITAGSGRFLEEEGETKAETVFRPTSLTATVEASFAPGDFTAADKKALVIYGNSKFEDGSETSVAATDSEATGTTFTYAVVNTDDLPDWLELNADTGVFSVKSPVNTNVQVEDGTKATYAEAGAVDNEVVLTVRITTNAGKSKDVTYTVNVEPGQLAVTHAAAQDTSVKRGDAYVAANTAGSFIPVDENGVPMYNETVRKHLFAYENVHDQAATQIDTTGHAGDVTNNDSGVYDKGTWTVAPTRFQGTGEPSTYRFTFTYKPDTAEEKWNYAAAVTDMTITIAKPPVGAEFADIIRNFADVENVLKPGEFDTDYSLVEKPEGYDGTFTTAPEAMAYTNETFRKNERITYLDVEPQYTVKLHSLDAAIHGTVFTVDELTGFKLAEGSAYPTFTNGQFASGDGEKTFVLELAPVSGKLWVGEHHAKFTLTGYSNAELAAEGGEPDVTATYELIVMVDPKVITKVDVTVTDPETEPTEVKGTTEDDEPVDNETPDDKGNVPIQDVTVTWKPEPGEPDGKHTEVKVDVTIDPNYVYAEEDDTTPDVKEDITENTDLTVTDHLTPDPEVERDPEDGDHIIHITQKIPYLMHDDVKDGSDPADTTGPKVDDRRTVSVMQGATGLGSYTINLGAYGANVYDVQWTVAQDTITSSAENGIGATLGTLPTGFDLTVDGAKQSVVLDLSAADTSKVGTYSLTLLALGKANADDPEDARTIQSTYVFQITIRSPGGGGGVVETCPCKVLYHVGIHGVTADATIEDVSESSRPSKVPTVTALDGYVFRGWSLTNPATLKKGEKIELVDPKTVTAKGETMTFYAVIIERPYHEHYVIGYPNGNFGPADNIDRASVATIIARAILPDFKEGSNYGNPGGYTDVAGHWAESAIAYCSKYGVFEGYTDGTFKPNQPITRQEFALVIARLDGVMTPGEMDFTDIDEAGSWALGGIYTAYKKGWVNGYTDGSFKPLNNIRRDEAVKVFNAYLNRGVDADGLRKLHEYVHSGVASNVTGNGTDEYMTWPDVPQGHWAYYEIVEAANDHEFVPDFESELGYTLPEEWDKCWIDERWRYHDDLNDGGPNAALLSAGFRVWLH